MSLRSSFLREKAQMGKTALMEAPMGMTADRSAPLPAALGEQAAALPIQNKTHQTHGLMQSLHWRGHSAVLAAAVRAAALATRWGLKAVMLRMFILMELLVGKQVCPFTILLVFHSLHTAMDMFTQHAVETVAPAQMALMAKTTEMAEAAEAVEAALERSALHPRAARWMGPHHIFTAINHIKIST